MSIDWSKKYKHHAFYTGMLKTYQSPIIAQYLSDKGEFLCGSHGVRTRNDFLWIGDEVKAPKYNID